MTRVGLQEQHAAIGVAHPFGDRLRALALGQKQAREVVPHRVHAVLAEGDPVILTAGPPQRVRRRVALNGRPVMVSPLRIRARAAAT
jgi:hypothetical protein